MLFARSSARLRRNFLGYRACSSTGIPRWRQAVETLLKRSNDLDATISHSGLSAPLTQNESYSLFNDWRQILFQIPKDESTLLSKSANQIDTLLHHNLDKLHSNKQQQQQRRRRRHQQGSPLLLDDVTTGIYAWGRTATLDQNSPMRAEALLDKFLQVSDNTKVQPPTANMCAAMVYCWSQASQNDRASEKCLEWFQKLHQVDAATWNALLRIHVRQKKFSSLEKELLSDYSFLNDGYTFCSLVEGWLNSNLHKQAHEELQKGVAFCLERGEDQIPALQQLLFLYLSQSIQKGRVEEAERVLNQAIQIQESRMEFEVLQTKHFVVVMNALATRGNTPQTNKLFQQLKILYEKGAQQLEPNYQILVILLSAISKEHDPKSLQIGEDLLSTIEAFLLQQDQSSNITNHAYNVMLDFYVRSPHVYDTNRRVEEVIERMKRLSEEHQNPRLLPDKSSYASLIKAIVKQGGKFSEVESILLQLEDSNQPSMKPDRKIYAIVLESLFASEDKDALDKSNELIERMKTNTKLQPDRVIYTVLMKIHSLCKNVKGSDQVLRQMIQAYKSGRTDCRPNEEAFVTAMSTWEQSDRSNSVDGALRIFNDMIALYKNGNVDCKPSLKSFGKLMVILAKSKYETKMNKGKRLLAEMHKYGVIADQSMYNWYIRGLATVQTKDESLVRKSWKEAQATFLKLREMELANSHTYNSMFYACDNLLQNQEDNIIRDIFQKCRDDGMVNRRILTSLRRSINSNLYSELTGLDPSDNNIQMKKIPESWKRNIQKKHKK